MSRLRGGMYLGRRGRGTIQMAAAASSSPPPGSPEISISIDTVPAQTPISGGTFSPPDPDIGSVVEYVITATNDGDAELVLENITVDGAVVLSATAWSDLTLAPAGTATSTITLATASPGAQVGDFQFLTNDPDDNEDIYIINVTYDVLAPEVSLSINSAPPQTPADNDTFSPDDPIIGIATQYTVTVTNTGGAVLNLTNGTRFGAVTAISAWSDTTVNPSESATCTITLDTATSGAKSGWFEFLSDDPTGGEDDYHVDVAYDVLAPEMAVLGNGNEITDGDATPSATDHTAFAATTIGTTVTRTYTIQNNGTADLEDIVVTPPAGFTLTDAPAGTIAASTSDTFTIRCDAGSVGTLTGTVSIANSDADENPYTFDISCVVADTFTNFVQTTIIPVRWYRMVETSGTNEPNAINPGTNDATISGCTLNQTGQLGATHAYDYDGVDDYVLAPASADINGILPATWILLLKVDSRGEGNFARLVNKTGDIQLFIDSADATSPYSVTAQVNFSGGQLSNTWANVLPVSTWTLLALRINADNTLDLFVNGTKQATSSAGSGTKSSSANGAYIGNNAAQTATVDGLIDEFIFENSAVSDANNLTLAQLAGLA